MLQARFVFPNPEGGFSPGQSYFYPGQFVKIRLKGYIRTDAILIPQRAVQQGSKGSFVYVIDGENKAELRPILASTWRGNEWLIESGLRSGDRVVVEGFHRIQPGIQVNAIQYQREPASSNNTGEHSKMKKAPRTTIFFLPVPFLPLSVPS